MRKASKTVLLFVFARKVTRFKFTKGSQTVNVLPTQAATHHLALLFKSEI